LEGENFGPTIQDCFSLKFHPNETRRRPMKDKDKAGLLQAMQNKAQTTKRKKQNAENK